MAPVPTSSPATLFCCTKEDEDVDVVVDVEEDVEGEGDEQRIASARRVARTRSSIHRT